MIFEYDANKSALNKIKHGIDFEEAQRLWQDLWMLEAPVKTIDEPRFIVIGVINKKHWTAVCTRRQQNIRLISVRRARKQEIAFYESERI
jgi:uncharacterized protein